jgi:hypothetical protein
VRTGLAVPVAAVVFYFGIAVYAIVPFRKGRRVSIHPGELSVMVARI